MTLLSGADAWVIWAVCAALLAGGIVKGVSGLGLPLVAAPVLANFIPVPQAIALLTVPSIVTSIWQVVHGGHYVGVMRRMWPFIVAMGCGIVAGVSVLVSIDVKLLYLLLGAFVAAFSLLFVRRVVFMLTPNSERWAAPMFGLAAGFIGGVSMMFGPIFAMYLSGLGLDKNRFVATVSTVNLSAALILALALSRHDVFDVQTFAASTALTIPTLAGIFIGQRLRARIDEESFRRALAIFLLVVGANLIRRGFS